MRQRAQAQAWRHLRPSFGWLPSRSRNPNKRNLFGGQGACHVKGLTLCTMAMFWASALRARLECPLRARIIVSTHQTQNALPTKKHARVTVVGGAHEGLDLRGRHSMGHQEPDRRVLLDRDRRRQQMDPLRPDCVAAHEHRRGCAPHAAVGRRRRRFAGNGVVPHSLPHHNVLLELEAVDCVAFTQAQRVRIAGARGRGKRRAVCSRQAC